MAGVRQYDREKFDKALRDQYEAEIAHVEAAGWTLGWGPESNDLCDSGGQPASQVLDRFARRKHRTNEERLAYYRAHGLDCCDDYPGGDAAFAADVLSGEYHDENGVMAEPPREDAYIISKMRSGRFKFTREFMRYGWSRFVRRAILDNCRKNGFDLR